MRKRINKKALDREFNHKKIPVKLIIIIVLFFVILFLLSYIIKIAVQKSIFENNIASISKLNERTIFSIDRIYLYSSATATDNKLKKPMWDLNLYQYTDIALYINNHSESGATKENTIRSLKIDNVKFNNLDLGVASLYYKNVNNFAKFDLKEENKIENSLDFNIVNDSNINYENPEVYGNLQNPITLEYVNSSIKQNNIISDITNPLNFDGSLLKKSGIVLDSISCVLSFNISIINNLDQTFVTTVYIDIPLENKLTGTTIYDGHVIKDTSQTNLIKFLRTK